MDSAWWVLRLALGIGPVLAGLDKFVNVLRLSEARKAAAGVTVAEVRQVGIFNGEMI